MMKKHSKKTCIALNINCIYDRHKNNDKPPQNQRQMDATGSAAVVQCQDCIRHACFRAMGDTILTWFYDVQVVES